MRRTVTTLAALVTALLLILPDPWAFCQVQPTHRPSGQNGAPRSQETRDLVALVREAADLVHANGEAAFAGFRVAGSRWRQGETYIFVLDPEGNMLVHPDPAMEGRNQLAVRDINGKPIIRGLIDAATSDPNKQDGWYHYEWPVPGGLLPRWKSTYVRLVKAPSGSRYIVGSGAYDDRMERAFVVDAVKDAVSRIERNGRASFALFRDPTGPFIAKDAYIFVYDRQGICLVLPPFSNLEGRNLMGLKDTNGKLILREMLEGVERSGSGWVDYMWPKPGENVSTQKSAYVSKAQLGDDWVLVGCGVYLADAPKAIPSAKKMTASALVTLVRDASALFENQGERAYPEFRAKGSRWFRDDTYFYVMRKDGTIVFDAANPEEEGESFRDAADVIHRPYGKMILEAAAGPSGEGWAHYMYPEPGSPFPTWKSTFVKRISFPSGTEHIIGCGVYNMQLDRTLVEDVVDRAAALVAERGKEAFGRLRDKKGPFVFMDTYIFLDTADGIELVNAAQPSVEGMNFMNVRDLKGKYLTREYIDAAMKRGRAWVEYYWYRPGSNVPTRKLAYVRKVQSGSDTYVVGSGFYPEDEDKKMTEPHKISWITIEKQKTGDTLSRQIFHGKQATLARYQVKPGAGAERHSHPNEEYACAISGTLKYTFDDREVKVNPGEVLVIPPNIPHSVVSLEDAEFLVFFAPTREDWRRGEDQYLRK